MLSKYYNSSIIIRNDKTLLPIRISFVKKNSINFTSIIYIYLHVSIIIIFEILFYFLFVIKKEYQVFDYLINDITKDLDVNFDNKSKIILNEIFKNLTNYLIITNYNNINNRALKDKECRISRQTDLYHISLIIITSLIILCLIIVIVGIKLKKIKLKCLLCDLFIMFTIISLFEYIFFIKIISHIEPISLYEILNDIIIKFEIKY